MKERLPRVISICLVLLILLSIPTIAHSGRTDSQGGHRDNNNVSGLGPYHYHHGYGPHLHPGGICPYAPKDTIAISNQPSTMNVGDSLALTWEVTYYSGSSSVSWASSDPSILTVDNGTLMAKKAGTATITANLHNGSKSFNVAVKEVPISSIAVSVPAARVAIKDSISASCSITPVNATNQAVTWSSSDPNVAAVSSNGDITGQQVGTAKITACAEDGKTDSVDIEVYEILPSEIVLNAENAAVEIGTRGALTATVLPENTSKKDVSWESSDTNCVSISQSGEFECMNIGKSVITATCQNVSSSVEIEVTPVYAKSISFDFSKMKMPENNKFNIGDSLEPIVTIQPENTTNKNVAFTSSNPEVVLVEGEQLIALDHGTAIITATTGDISTTLEITVKRPLSPVVVAIVGTVAIGGIAGFIVLRRKKARGE